MGKRAVVWELEQDGTVVAGGEGPDLSDGHHYAMIYNQDGPVCLYTRKGKKRELVLAASQGALAKMWAK